MMTLAITISERLRTIARFCPPGAKVADIGSDHALLAAYLLRNGIASRVIAGELNEGPFQAAKKQLAALGLMDRSEVRKGDGLAVLSAGEVDVICIAGMGGQLIASILAAGKTKLEGVRRLILQPNVGEEVVRRWLLENGWQLVDEAILEEDGIIYEILVAEPGEPLAPYKGKERSVEELIRIGPHLWEVQPPVLAQKWERERAKWRHILAKMTASDREETRERQRQIRRELEWIEGVIACLRTDKP